MNQSGNYKKIDWNDKKREILSRLNIESEFATMGISALSPPNHAGWIECRNPFKKDDTPSAGFNVGSGSYRGYLVTFNSDGLYRDKMPLWDVAYNLHPRLSGESFSEILKHYAEQTGVDVLTPANIPPTAENVQYYQKEITLGVLDYLHNKRHLTDDSIRKYEIGWSPKRERISYPVYDSNGALVNIRFHSWKKGVVPKVQGWKGYNQKRVWGMDRLSKLPPGSTVCVTEGEFDSMVIEQETGLISVSPTNGKEAFDSNWVEWFHGHHVVFVWDCDREGREAIARKVLPQFETALQSGKIPSIKVLWLFENANSKERKDATDYFAMAGGTGANLLKMIESTSPISASEIHSSEPAEDGIPDENAASNNWEIAYQTFPRTGFPWEVLPDSISISLQQLARSHATSANPIPGAALAIYASVLGATVSVSPKASWIEHLILWIADLRKSGMGKTGSARALCSGLYKAQKKADDDYFQRINEEQAKPPKDRTPVPRARGYFTTDLTIEGLRNDISGHGGTVAILDELSSFISGQNQYKSKGTDREAWLALHDGDPARIVRAKESLMIRGARVSICGGIQPKVWQKVFGGDDGLYVDDGTIYRFLVTYESESFFPLTDETWSDYNRSMWEKTLEEAMQWANNRIRDENWKPLILCLDDDARNIFIKWRNDIYEVMQEFPNQIKGFIPKIVGSALRLSGVLYCMNRFATGKALETALGVADIKKGILAASFYMSNIIDATKALIDDAFVPIELDANTLLLAKTLESLHGQKDSNRLAIGLIAEVFNSDLQKQDQITVKAVGQLIRKCGLTIPANKTRVNKRAGVHFLSWDNKTTQFIEHVNNVHHVNKANNHKGLGILDDEKQCQQRQPNSNPQNFCVDDGDFEKTTSTSANDYDYNVCGHEEHVDVRI